MPDPCRRAARSSVARGLRVSQQDFVRAKLLSPGAVESLGEHVRTGVGKVAKTGIRDEVGSNGGPAYKVSGRLDHDELAGPSDLIKSV